MNCNQKVRIMMTEIFMSIDDENKEKQNSIVVPIDDELDTVSSNSPNTVDELAMELAPSVVCNLH